MSSYWAVVVKCVVIVAGRAGSQPVKRYSAAGMTVGGAGKTPMAIAVAERLIARGATPHFLSRGYGGDITGPTRVDPTRHWAEHTGDEALLLGEQNGTVLDARDLAAAAQTIPYEVLTNVSRRVPRIYLNG